MAKKKMSERIREAFPDSDHLQYAEAYLDTLRTNERETETSYRRTTFLFFLLVIVFELLTQAAISEVTIAGAFKVTDLSLIQKSFPLAIAFLYYELVSFFVLGRYLAEVHDRLLMKTHRSFYDSDLEFYLHPPSTLRTLQVLNQQSEGRVNTILVGAQGPYHMAIVVVGFLFEGYAFYRLWSTFGVFDPIVIIVVVLSLMFLLMAALSLWVLLTDH